ncbi:MAG: hypothetical protein ACOCWA_07880 [Bacteroidota bacterium]
MIDNSGGFDSFSKINTGELDFSNNIFYNIAKNDPNNLFILEPSAAGSPDQSEIIEYFMEERSNTIEDPNISANELPYDLLPVNTVFDNLAEYESSWFEKVSYKGAFGSRNWLQGWSLLWEEGLVE